VKKDSRLLQPAYTDYFCNNASALTSQPETVSTLNFASPTTTSNMTGHIYTSPVDATAISVNDVISDNMDKRSESSHSSYY
jgi:hypothetical protein